VTTRFPDAATAGSGVPLPERRRAAGVREEATGTSTGSRCDFDDFGARLRLVRTGRGSAERGAVIGSKVTVVADVVNHECFPRWTSRVAVSKTRRSWVVVTVMVVTVMVVMMVVVVVIAIVVAIVIVVIVEPNLSDPTHTLRPSFAAHRAPAMLAILAVLVVIIIEVFSIIGLINVICVICVVVAAIKRIEFVFIVEIIGSAVAVST
jgi:hypothetical protein